MQSRIGPYRVGPHGLLQPIADALKLMMKEDIIPNAADRKIYNLAPIVFLIPCMLIFATIPFAPGLGVGDLNIGILFFLAVSSMEIVGLFMAGWGSNNKYALLSAMRAVNQIISYDLPFIFSALIPVLLTGSLKLGDIAAAQQGSLLHWFIFYPLIGQAGVHHVHRLDARRREPRAVRHPRGGIGAGRRLSRRIFGDEVRADPAWRVRAHDRLVVPRRAAVPWRVVGPGPGILGPFWFLGKMLFMFLLVTWIRWSFVRIRVDQILALSWKVLMPATLMLLVSTAVVVVWRTNGF